MRLRTSSDPTPKALREAAAAAPPDPAYLADLRRFGDHPSAEIMARGWERFGHHWKTSQAGRPYLETKGLRVIVFDKRPFPRVTYSSATGSQRLSDEDEEELEFSAPFTIGFGHDDGGGLKYLKGSAATEEEAMRKGSALALAFTEAGHAPRSWAWPPMSPKQTAWLKMGDTAYAARLRRDRGFEDELDRQTAAWRERRWREKAAMRIWEQERKRS